LAPSGKTEGVIVGKLKKLNEKDAIKKKNDQRKRGENPQQSMLAARERLSEAMDLRNPGEKFHLQYLEKECRRRGSTLNYTLET